MNLSVRADRAPIARETPDFGAFVRAVGRAGELVVQPRMGFSDPGEMRAGLLATRDAQATTVGTLTLDSYTRVGELQAVENALREKVRLNGYPIVSHPHATTREVLAGVRSPLFPVQVRHGSAVPLDIFSTMLTLGLNASEGGPVSYCLPYSRTPLPDAVDNWRRCCELFARFRDRGIEPHLETFGGCMLGQLCPPSHLIAMSVLEGLFFHQHGLRSISMSYAQQTNMDQDREAVSALRRLCAEVLPVENWHVVIYAYMGMYPTTEDGAYRLLAQAAELAVATGSERLIVKTVAESRRIPAITENVAALEHAAQIARDAVAETDVAEHADSQTYLEAKALIEAVLELETDVGRALLRGFERGYLDIPYCVHPNNRGETRSYIDSNGWLRWAEIGSLPLSASVGDSRSRPFTSADLLNDLSYVQRKFDLEASETRAPRPR